MADMLSLALDKIAHRIRATFNGIHTLKLAPTQNANVNSKSLRVKNKKDMCLHVNDAHPLSKRGGESNLLEQRLVLLA